MNFWKLLLVLLFVAATMAAPLYPEMSATDTKKNLMAHDVEDRNNPALINLITSLTFQTNLIFLAYKWRIIFCILDATTCGSSTVTPTNLHTYDTLEAPNMLAAADVLMSNLSAQNADTLMNFMGMTSSKNNTSSTHELAPQQKLKHFVFPVSKVTPFAQLQKTALQHQAEPKVDTVDTVHLSFPFRVIAPYSQFQWHMYPELWPQFVSPSARFR